MKNKNVVLDVVLITLWSVLFINASKIETEGLLFGWPIHVHLTITAVLIAMRIIFRKFVAQVNS